MSGKGKGGGEDQLCVACNKVHSCMEEHSACMQEHLKSLQDIMYLKPLVHSPLHSHRLNKRTNKRT
jgi:hypothetical protein